MRPYTGLSLTVLCMALYYSFSVIVNVSLLLNLILSIVVMFVPGAILTLFGIAVTLGIAVDTNV